MHDALTLVITGTGVTNIHEGCTYHANLTMVSHASHIYQQWLEHAFMISGGDQLILHYKYLVSHLHQWLRVHHQYNLNTVLIHMMMTSIE